MNMSREVLIHCLVFQILVVLIFCSLCFITEKWKGLTFLYRIIVQAVTVLQVSTFRTDMKDGVDVEFMLVEDRPSAGVCFSC